jgi:hypothetical protein
MKCATEDTFLLGELGELTINQSRAVEQHLAGCALCRQRQAAAKALVSDVARAAGPPDAEAGREAFVARVTDAARLASSNPAGQDPGAPVGWQGGGWWRRAAILRKSAVAAALLVMALFAAWMLRSPPGPDAAPALRGTIAARGGATHPALAAEILLVRGERLQPLGEETVGGSDGFAVRVTNTTPRPMHLLAFGVDAAGVVHWLFPAYRSAADNPRAVVVAPGTIGRLLADAVAPETPASGPFRVVTLLSPTAMTVKEVEARLASGPTGTGVAARFPSAVVRQWSATWRAQP